MRIATYNIWNSESGMPTRSKYIYEELQNVDADIVCLQEVSNQAMADEIASQSGYQFSFFDHYKDSEEGLCILSHTCFEKSVSLIGRANAICCSILWEGNKICIIDLHLPWDSAKIRTEQMINIISSIDEMDFDYIYMAGDFNCSEMSDIHRFLIGECLLGDYEANPCWYDLAAAFAETSNTELEHTLNFRKNPRFIGNTMELNARFDRILFRNTDNDFPDLVKCRVFGKKIYQDIGLSASDHYGVVIEVI